MYAGSSVSSVCYLLFFRFAHTGRPLTGNRQTTTKHYETNIYTGDDSGRHKVCSN